jgi:O-antigen/teichoic acid export membrane protein
LTAVSHPPHDTHADKRTILRGAGLAMAGFLVRPLARVPFLFIVGRIYGRGEFGRYVFAVGLLEAFAALCRLGLKDNLFRFLAEHPEDQQPILMEALTVAIGLSAVCAILVFFGAPLLGEALHTAPLWRMLGLMIPILPVFVATDLLFAAARFHRAVSYEVLGRSLVEPLMITGGALGFGLAGVGAPGLLIAYMTAQVLTLGVAAFGVARRFNLSLPVAPLDLTRLRGMVTRSAPTGFADCVSLGFNAVGIVLVGNLLGEAALGVYGMAMNLETAISKVRQAFDMIVVPVVSRGLSERGPAYVVDQLRMIGRSIITAQLPLFAVSLLFGADILGLFSHSFRSGAVLLALLALAAVIDGGINLAQVPLFLSRPKANLAIAVVALAVNLGLGVLLTPRLGVAGIGVAIVGALALSALARQVLVARIFGRSLLGLSLWRPIAAALGATAVSALLLRLLPDRPLDHGLAAAGLAVSYIGLLALLDPDLRRRAVGWARARL